MRLGRDWARSPRGRVSEDACLPCLTATGNPGDASVQPHTPSKLTIATREGEQARVPTGSIE